MTIEEAIEEFSFFYEGDYITRGMSEAKDIVLDELERKDTEINKLNLVIDRMAERMDNLQYEIRDDCFIPREYADIDDCVKKESCKECIKEYFMKEVADTNVGDIQEQN